MQKLASYLMPKKRKGIKKVIIWKNSYKSNEGAMQNSNFTSGMWLDTLSKINKY